MNYFQYLEKVTKLSNKFILVNLFGDLVEYEITKIIRKYLKSKNDSADLLNKKSMFHKSKDEKSYYICLLPDDLDRFYEVINNIVIVFSIKDREIVNIYRSIHNLWKNNTLLLTRNDVEKYFKKNLDNIKGYKLICGKEAINLLRSTGHLTAEEFIKDQIKLNNRNNE